MIIPHGHNILFTGDSITDAKRCRPVGEDMKHGLGNGYVALIANILEAWHPGHQHRIRNTGISGNTVQDLRERWQADVLDLKPDWLSVMVGINDCARSFHRPLITESQVSAETYRARLTELVDRTRPSVAGMVLLSPFYIDSSFGDPLRQALTAYGAAVATIADQFDCVFVDTQAAFDGVLRHAHSCRLSGDSVHPNPTGHMILAKAWLEAVGFSWAHLSQPSPS